MNHRMEYLHKFWARYPKKPNGNDWVYGRVVALEPLSLRSAGRLHQPMATEWFEQKPGAPPWQQVIEPQDWVAVNQKTGALELLAPALSQPLHQRMPNHRVQKGWSDFLQFTRQFFIGQGFMEVSTPTLVPSPGTEPFMNPFKTEVCLGDKRVHRYLPFSPEFHLKKMLSVDGGKIFEIKTCFRNGDLGVWHQPEFWMLEWYESFSDLKDLQRTLQNWLMHIQAHLAVDTGAGSGIKATRGDLSEPAAAKSGGVQKFNDVPVVSLAELFRRHLQVELAADPSEQELRGLLTGLNVGFDSNDSWNDLFSRLILELEPYLGETGPIIVEAFPRPLAQLARLREDGWADRCELYWRGVELGNAFHELNDPEEQARRFDLDLQLRAEWGGGAISLDPEFMAALSSGLPPSAGIAVGLERLFGLFFGLDAIDQVRAFPITHSESIVD